MRKSTGIFTGVPGAPLFSIILIFGLGIIIYSNSFQGSFHFDDVRSILKNTSIRNLNDAVKIWKYYPCRFVTFYSYALNYHFHRLDVYGYHLFNLGVHLCSAFFVWWLVLLTLSSPALKGNKITGHAHLVALLTSLVFVSHPIQTQAVTYIYQRSVSLAALFYLASLCLYVKSRLLREGEGASGLGMIYYICSWLMAVAAMFTKETAITLPLMILFYEFTFLKTQNKLNWKYPAPFLMTLMVIPLTMFLTKSPRFHEVRMVVEGPNGISPVQYFFTQLRVMMTYIRLLFLPVNQNLDYDYHISKSILEWPALVSAFSLIAILFWAKRLFIKYRIVSFACFWYFLTLLPESSFLPSRNVILEHRLYLPLAGYSLLLVSGMYYLLGKERLKAMIAALGVIIAFNSVLAYQRNEVWKDDLSLWNDTIKKSPHKARVYNARGFFYFSEGNFEKAVSDYNQAISLNDNFRQAYFNRGFLYYRKGSYDKALFDYNKAISLMPNTSGGDQFARAYQLRADVYLAKGDYKEAISDYDQAVNLDPDLLNVYVDRGIAHASLGDYDQAIADYSKAIELKPDHLEAYNDRGAAYGAKGDFSRAILDFSTVLKIKPNLAQTHINRAKVYYLKQDYVNAWADVSQAELLGIPVNQAFVKELIEKIGIGRKN
jgi:tetratricopeptide (TPR) repeat protein